MHNMDDQTCTVKEHQRRVPMRSPKMGAEPSDAPAYFQEMETVETSNPSGRCEKRNLPYPGK